MIKNINGGKYITITGGTTSDPYISPGSAGSGMIRWNPNMNCMEVNDGSVWKQFTSTFPTIDLNSEAQELLDWAKQERDRQRLRQQRTEKNPALKKAYEAIQRAEENFDILDKLVGEDCQICSINS
jgi:hypothetical protein